MLHSFMLKYLEKKFFSKYLVYSFLIIMKILLGYLLISFGLPVYGNVK